MQIVQCPFNRRKPGVISCFAYRASNPPRNFDQDDVFNLIGNYRPNCLRFIRSSKIWSVTAPIMHNKDAKFRKQNQFIYLYYINLYVQICFVFISPTCYLKLNTNKTFKKLKIINPIIYPPRIINHNKVNPMKVKLSTF